MKKIYSWLEKKLKTDVVYLLKGGFWLALGQGFRMASGLLLLVAFANLLPKEAYGTYQFVMAGAGIISALTLSGMGSAITRATAQGAEGSLRYGFRVKMLWSITMVLAAGAVALYYFFTDNRDLAIAFLIVGAFSPLLESFRMYRFYLRGKQLFKESELLGFQRQLIPLIVMTGGLFLTQDPVTLLAIYFGSHTFAVGLVYIQVIRKYKLPIKKDTEMIGLGKHLSFLNIIGTIASNLDKLLIFYFLGPVLVAAYVLAQTPITHVRKILAILTEMTIPKLSKRGFEELQQTLPRKVLLFSLLVGLVVFTYVLVAPFLFSVFFPAYPESILLTQAMVLTLLFYPRAIFSQALTAHALTKEIYYTKLCAPILLILFLLILLPIYGVWGAVGATLLSNIIASQVVRHYFLRAIPKNLRNDC